MHLRRLILENVMSHAATDLTVPPTGVVLVTGDNGSGKSSLVEGVSLALWGKSVRGGHLWAGETGAVEAHFAAPDIGVRRALVKSKVRLTHGALGATPWPKHDTATKAQLVLDALVPSFDLWRRTAVFCSADVSTFTSATDGERKRLMETILGLERFDRAADIARDDARRLAVALNSARTTLAVATERVNGAQAALDAARSLGPADVCSAQTSLFAAIEAAERAEAWRADLEDYADAVWIELQSSTGRLAAYAERTRALDQAQARAERASCPTCNRPADPDERAAALASIAAERADLDAAVALVTAAVARQRESYSAAHSETKAAAAAAAAAAADVAALTSALAQAKRDAARVQDADAALAARTAEHAAAAALAADAESAHATAAAVAAVFGLGGVRAHLLHAALAGVTSVANAWLDRLAPGRVLRIELSAGDDAKSSIALAVHGAGNGHGYPNASGGERRRIDIAIMLALAEVSASAHGAKPGTLFLDEVFDALDADGVDALVDVLADLSTDRAVVVITHNAAIMQRVAAVQRWTVDRGTVRVS